MAPIFAKVGPTAADRAESTPTDNRLFLSIVPAWTAVQSFRRSVHSNNNIWYPSYCIIFERAQFSGRSPSGNDFTTYTPGGYTASRK